MNSVVADGRDRLMRALPSTAEERKCRFASVMLQLEAQYRDELQSAGFLRRIGLRRKIKEEAAAIMRREFGIPSDCAHYFAIGQEPNKAPEPTPSWLIFDVGQKMHREFQSLIADFLATVARRFAQLQREVGVAVPASSTGWATNGLKKGMLSDGAIYSKHGLGCLIESQEDGVDFVFGDHGEIDGFDAWRLLQFAEISKGRHAVGDETKIQSLLDAAVIAGEIEKRGSLYYLRRKEPNKAPEPTTGLVTPRALE